jgi:hypothetical protein
MNYVGWESVTSKLSLTWDGLQNSSHLNPTRWHLEHWPWKAPDSPCNPCKSSATPNNPASIIHRLRLVHQLAPLRQFHPVGAERFLNLNHTPAVSHPALYIPRGFPTFPPSLSHCIFRTRHIATRTAYLHHDLFPIPYLRLLRFSDSSEDAVHQLFITPKVGPRGRARPWEFTRPHHHLFRLIPQVPASNLATWPTNDVVQLRTTSAGSCSCPEQCPYRLPFLRPTPWRTRWQRSWRA